MNTNVKNAAAIGVARIRALRAQGGSLAASDKPPGLGHGAEDASLAAASAGFSPVVAGSAMS